MICLGEPGPSTLQGFCGGHEGSPEQRFVAGIKLEVFRDVGACLLDDVLPTHSPITTNHLKAKVEFDWSEEWFAPEDVCRELAHVIEGISHPGILQINSVDPVVHEYEVRKNRIGYYLDHVPLAEPRVELSEPCPHGLGGPVAEHVGYHELTRIAGDILGH